MDHAPFGSGREELWRQSGNKHNPFQWRISVKPAICITIVSVFAANVAPASAVMFKLTHAGGGDEINLLPGLSADLQFRIVTHAVDTFAIAEANMALSAPYPLAF